MKTFGSLIGIAVLGFCVASCGKSEDKEAKNAPRTVPGRVNSAKAVLNPTKGNKAHGQVSFTVIEGGVKIIADVDGLTPGKHGFHIHEKGDCSAPDASSAGDHFNPANKKHGSPNDTERHVGDLGNLEADSKGHAHYERIDKVISLSGPNNILGRSVVIHEKADDFKTQPSGDAGSRQACGAIVGFH